MLINQTHPKILGRIQMGIDAARQSMNRGEPFILEFCFTKALQRLYFNTIDAQRVDHNSFAKEMKSCDIQYADIVIRFEGDCDHQGFGWNMKTQLVTFQFDDLLVADVTVRNKNSARERLTQDPVTLGEIRTILRGWTFEEVPMSDPARQSVAYSYQAANRLYQQLDAPEGAIGYDHQPRTQLRKYDGHNMSRLPEEEDVISEDHIDPRIQDERPHGFMSRAVIHGHQGSNRSTASSSEADSGFYGNDHDTDSSHQRGSYSKGYAMSDNEITQYQSPRKQHPGYEVTHSSNSEDRYSPVIQEAYHNPGFERSPEPKNEDILQKHKQMAAKMLQGGHNFQNNNNYSAREVDMDVISKSHDYSYERKNVHVESQNLRHNQGAQLKSPSTSSQGPEMSESFI